MGFTSRVPPSDQNVKRDLYPRGLVSPWSGRATPIRVTPGGEDLTNQRSITRAGHLFAPSSVARRISKSAHIVDD